MYWLALCYDGPCVIDGWGLFVSQRRTGLVPAPQKTRRTSGSRSALRQRNESNAPKRRPGIQVNVGRYMLHCILSAYSSDGLWCNVGAVHSHCCLSVFQVAPPPPPPTCRSQCTTVGGGDDSGVGLHRTATRWCSLPNGYPDYYGTNKINFWKRCMLCALVMQHWFYFIF